MKAAQARDGIAGRAARGFEAGGGQGVVEQFGARFVDQVGAGLGDVVLHEEGVIDLRDHIHDGVAKGDDVVLHRHEIISLRSGAFVGGKPGRADLKTGGAATSSAMGASETMGSKLRCVKSPF
jgi:hypothetical protein